MKTRFAIVGATLILAASAPATAQEITPQTIKMACNVSGLYADGARIGGTVSEEISADIRRSNDPNRPTADIRVTSNGRTYPASLLHVGRDQVAFVLANKGQIDGVNQTLSVIYELRLDQMRLKRTVMTLFSSQGNSMQSAESNCIRLNPTTGAPAAPAAAATAPAAAAGATPDWLVELRRKLKECAGKDPLSQQSCNERMRARFCVNRTVKVAECEGQ